MCKYMEIRGNFMQSEKNTRAISRQIWPFEIVLLVVCKIALLQGNNNHYANPILDALYLFVPNETHFYVRYYQRWRVMSNRPDSAFNCGQSTTSANESLYFRKTYSTCVYNSI